MKDFDIIRAERENADRTFKIGGETFTFRPYVAPEHIIEMQMAITDDEYLTAVDRILPAHLLEEGQEDKWMRARKENPQPLSIYDISQVINHIQAVVSGRPTVPSTGSLPTASPTGMILTGGSSTTGSTSGDSG